MKSVNVRTYEANTPQDQENLMNLTIEELGTPGFPTEINVLISPTENPLTVIAIEPFGIAWNWTQQFSRFKKSDRPFFSRL